MQAEMMCGEKKFDCYLGSVPQREKNKMIDYRPVIVANSDAAYVENQK
jgi:hypothetical protein